MQAAQAVAQRRPFQENIRHVHRVQEHRLQDCQRIETVNERERDCSLGASVLIVWVCPPIHSSPGSSHFSPLSSSSFVIVDGRPSPLFAVAVSSASHFPPWELLISFLLFLLSSSMPLLTVRPHSFFFLFIRTLGSEAAGGLP